MKKVFLLLAAVACIAVSCKDKEEKGPVLTPDQNKETLDETMTKAVEMLEVENWQSTADLITSSLEVFQSIEASDASYEEWIEGQSVETTLRDEEPYEYLIDLSKVNGKVSIKDNKVYAEAGTGLSVAYNLADGTAVDGKITVMNSKTTALIDTDYNNNWDADGNLNQTLWSKTYLVIPASIDAVVNAGGKKAFSAKITTDVNMAGEEPKPTDTFAATCEVSADKYTFAVTRAKYSQTEVVVNASIKYDKQTVVAATFEAKGKIETTEDGTEIDPLTSTGNVKASFGILDNIVIKGDLNWTEISKLVNAERGNTEAEARALAATAEKYMNLTLYIQHTAQAKLGWEAYIPYQDESMTVWGIQPVVRFEDGSDYMLPEAFFNEANFPKTVEAVNKALAEINAFLGGGEEEEVEPLK